MKKINSLNCFFKLYLMQVFGVAFILLLICILQLLCVYSPKLAKVFADDSLCLLNKSTFIQNEFQENNGVVTGESYDTNKSATYNETCNTNEIAVIDESYIANENDSINGRFTLDEKVKSYKSVRTSGSVKNHESVEMEFIFQDKHISQILKPRQVALKHFESEGKFDRNKLNSFLKELYNRNILPQYALEFCFENFKEIVDEVAHSVNSDAQDAKLMAIKNTGNVQLKNAKCGYQIDKNALIFAIFCNLAENVDKIDVPYYVLNPQIDESKALCGKYLRGKFYTTYASSTAERKHNIEKALSEFDGIQIAPGEILSFNQTTGVRNAENGYKGAKIIANGKFEDGIGGGVCQASTTLYNACLVSGLEIVEANQHSLKVGYIAPSFDAMVNYGSSDLKIRNNTDEIITIATKCDGNTCEVFVYGEVNPYKIVRRSETISDIEPKEDIIVSVTDYDGNIEVADGEEVYAHYPKKGLISEGYLDYYQGEFLVATKKIRKNKYNASQGIKVVGRPKSAQANMVDEFMFENAN